MKTRLAASAFALIAGSAAAQEPPASLASTLPASVARAAPALQAYSTAALFGKVWTDARLSPRDRALATLAAQATRRETDALPATIALALDAGVAPAEIAESIAHLAFYAGWGSALAAAEAAAPVFEARGVVADALPGADVALLDYDREAEAARQARVSDGFAATSPGVVDATESLLFLDLWRRPGLAPRDRSMITVAALVAAGQPEQMTFHLDRAMDNGLTQEEAGAMLAHLAFYAGWPRVFSALPVARAVFEARAQRPAQ